MGCIPSRAAPRSADPTPARTLMATPTATPAPTPIPWTGLPPELLLEVSGRLQDAADLVRFKAVCRPWHEAAALISRPTWLPWVLTSCDGQMLHSIVDFHCPLETPGDPHDPRDVILAEPPGASTTNRNWVASADGTAAWFFVMRPRPKLINVLTGAAKPLPPLPVDARISMENLRGVVHNDGTVFLYNFINEFPPQLFTAAILCSGNVSWTVMIKKLQLFAQPYAMYHDGNVLVVVEDSLLCFQMMATTGFEPNGDDVIDNRPESRWDLCEDMNNHYDRGYILESDGGLLLACVVLKQGLSRYGCSNPAPMLRVTLCTMRKESSNGKMHWVKRDGRNLRDYVLFLGYPASIAMKLGAGGGCAYFVYWGAVFRYSFVEDETKVVKWLRPECRTDEACVWLRPSLSFTPIKEIKERLEARDKMKRD